MPKNWEKTPNQRQKASYIRRKQLAGKAVSDDEKDFLQWWEQQRPKGRDAWHATGSPSTTADASTDGASLPQVQTTQVWPSSEDRKLPPVDLPASSTPPPTPATPGATKPQPTTPGQSTPPSPGAPKAVERVEALAAAEMLNAFVDEYAAKARAEGLFMIPQAAIDKLIKPMNLVTANMVTPEVPPEKIAPAITVGSTLFILLQGLKAEKQKAIREGKLKPKPTPQQPVNGAQSKPPVAPPVQPGQPSPPTTHQAKGQAFEDIFPKPGVMQ